jgi:hypothetical protein
MEELFKQGIFYDPGYDPDHGVIVLLKYNSQECVLVDSITIKRPKEMFDNEWRRTVEAHVRKMMYKYEVTNIQNANSTNDKKKSKRKK